MVTVEGPGGVEDVVAMVMVDDEPELTDAGLNEAVAPAGRPLADREIVWAEPEVRVVDTVGWVEPPAVTVPLVGLTAIEKSLGATGRVEGAAWAAEVPVAVTVTAEVPGGGAGAEARAGVEATPALPDAGLHVPV